MSDPHIVVLDQFASAHLSDPGEAKFRTTTSPQATHDYSLEDYVDQAMANPADVAHRGRSLDVSLTPCKMALVRVVEATTSTSR